MYVECGASVVRYKRCESKEKKKEHAALCYCVSPMYAQGTIESTSCLCTQTRKREQEQRGTGYRVEDELSGAQLSREVSRKSHRIHFDKHFWPSDRIIRIGMCMCACAGELCLRLYSGMLRLSNSTWSIVVYGILFVECVCVLCVCGSDDDYAMCAYMA